MGPAEAEILQNCVRIAGEVAIGEEQQLGQLVELSLGHSRAFALGGAFALLGGRGLGAAGEGFI